KLRFAPPDLGRKLVAEMWIYPDGSRILELSTRAATDEAFQVAAETRAFLAAHGVDLSGEQETKTRKALEYFARERADDKPAAAEFPPPPERPLSPESSRAGNGAPSARASAPPRASSTCARPSECRRATSSTRSRTKPTPPSRSATTSWT